MAKLDQPTPMPHAEDLTRILGELRPGDDRATDEVFPLVYEELRQLAASKMARENRGHTLQPTALVHEAYLRLIRGADGGSWENRRHFFAAAAEAMRRILIEHARARGRIKRRPATGVSDGKADFVVPHEELEDLLVLDDALERLLECDPEKGQLVKLKFFGGLTTAEAAEIMGLSLRTAERAWAFARAWLYREVEGGERSHE